MVPPAIIVSNHGARQLDTTPGGFTKALFDDRLDDILAEERERAKGAIC
jgi:hypothetical protein